MNRMQQWWRKWSYEIPLGFGNALWDVLVVQFADFLSRLTIRRVLKSVAIAILVMAFMQTFPIELAMLAAGDTLTYLEIAVIVRLAAGREMFRQMLRLAIQFAGLATRGAKPSWAIPRRGSQGCVNRAMQRRSGDRGASPPVRIRTTWPRRSGDTPRRSHEPGGVAGSYCFGLRLLTAPHERSVQAGGKLRPTLSPLQLAGASAASPT